ncbi:MAG TPA: hypothetical protein VNN80_29405 [Polyangiaceae bacterium]|jgi:hypothetical protein|nr:hypothetical protein [Polyangiaceae bacterium]
MSASERPPWNASPAVLPQRAVRLRRRTTRGARRICSLALLGFLAAQPSCTLAGLGAGIGMSASEPGPYEERPLSPAARYDARAFERLELSKGDLVQLLLLDGTNLEGEYIQLEAPTATDPEMYVLLVPVRENGHRPIRGKTPRHVPLSDVRTLGVEVIDTAWILGGTALGLALDVLVFGQLISAIQED